MKVESLRGLAHIMQISRIVVIVFWVFYVKLSSLIYSCIDLSLLSIDVPFFFLTPVRFRFSIAPLSLEQAIERQDHILILSMLHMFFGAVAGFAS